MCGKPAASGGGLAERRADLQDAPALQDGSTMLELRRNLPAGVLIGGEEGALVEAMAPTHALRFVAREADLQRSEGKVTGWRAAQGQALAATSEPNTGNSRLDEGTRPGLQFRDGVNCGFVLPAFAARADSFTVAVIYTSGGEARTLASVTTGQSHNLVFVSETKGGWVATDKSGAAALNLPRKAGPGTHLALLSYAGQTLFLRADGQTVSIPARLPKLDLPGDVFIGCRSNRPGLAKTQGQMLLHEAFFWPDRGLLASARAEDTACLAALDRYFRWTY
jgi:hypothetical protein